MTWRFARLPGGGPWYTLYPLVSGYLSGLIVSELRFDQITSDESSAIGAVRGSGRHPVRIGTHAPEQKNPPLRPH